MVCIYITVNTFLNGQEKIESLENLRDIYLEQAVWNTIVYMLMLPFMVVVSSLIIFLTSYHWVRVAGQNLTTYESIKKSYKGYVEHPV